MIAFLCGDNGTDVRHGGDAIRVRITDLVAGAPYTIRLVRRFGGDTYAAWIEALADAAGVIDTATATPLRGTYAHADVDGLFWSMQRIDAAAPEHGFALAVEQGGAVVAGRVLLDELLCPGVGAEPLAGGGVGTLYVPDVTPRPAIIVLGGSSGGLAATEAYAAALANHGFVALALAYFGAAGLPSALAEIPLEYVERAIDRLQHDPRVRGDRIAVVGRSRGGELALLLGSLVPAIRAVVAHVPSHYRWCGPDPETPAWCHRGGALPFLAPSGPPAIARLADGRIACATRDAFLAALDGADEHAVSAIEATRGPILVTGADDDQVWPSATFVERAMQRLSGRTGDAAIVFPSAGHGATLLPGDPTTEPVARHPVGGIWLAQGGTPEGTARAQRDAWTRVLAFLESNLR